MPSRTHTPRPWQIYRMGNATRICSVTPGARFGEQIAEVTSALDADAANANACLIAAAPDYDKAARAALPLLEHCVKRPGHEFWPNREEAEAVVRDLRAAIAKADGK